MDNNNTISINKAISTTDIICDQYAIMNVGGFVGSVSKLKVSTAVVLGAITLNRALGSTTNFEQITSDPSKVDSMFLPDGGDPTYIGGLIGDCKNLDNGSDNGKVLVASTIRDYAIAQKLNAYLGAVVGRQSEKDKVKVSTPLINVCENISLVGNELSGIKNISQDALSDANGDGVFGSIYNALNLKVDNSVRSRFFTKYAESQADGSIKVKEGCKLAPTIFDKDTVLESNNYYILQNDVTVDNTIVTSATNWVINGQGYSIKVGSDNTKMKTVIEKITQDSAVSAVMLNLSGSVTTDSKDLFAPFATFNYGFVFSCSVVGDVKTSLDSSTFIYSNFGVINKCFSMANLETNGAGGLVSANGRYVSDSEIYIGNIYDSYYTGSITISGVDNSTAVGTLAKDTTYGVISNSYTMADVFATTGTSKYEATHPVASITPKDNWKPTENMYRVYYDYIPYVAGNEGQNMTAIGDRTNNLNFISREGFYLWTSSFTGEVNNVFQTANTSNATVEEMFQTHWVIPQRNKSTGELTGELVEMFNKAEGAETA